MKLLITTGLFPPDIGGPAKPIERLAADLVNLGFVVTVLTYSSPEKKKRLFRLFSVSRAWPAIFRQLIFGLKTFFLAACSDIIYTADLYSPGYYSMLATKIFGKKLVVRFAGDSAWEIAQNLGLTNDDILTFQQKKYNAFIERRKRQRTKILKSAQAVIAVSNFMKELAIKLGVKPTRIKVIYNAVDFLPEMPKVQKPSQPVLVTACRLTPWKGVEMLIKIMPALVKDFPEIILQVIGDGSEKEKLVNLAEHLVLADRVIFHGPLSLGETLKIFSQSTIFVLDSNYEGLSHAVLEALSLELPVITTKVGGNPELIHSGENGLLVPYNNEQAWLEAIKRLLKDKALQEKFIEEGRKTLAAFKWSNLLEQTAGLFKKL